MHRVGTLFSHTPADGHCKTYGDAGSTGSHHIGLGIGLRFRVKFRVRIRVRAWSGVTLLAMLIVDPVSLYVLQ